MASRWQSRLNRQFGLSAGKEQRMKKLNDLMEAVMQGATLTGSEAMELLEVAKLAAQFTEANDRGDELAEKLDSGDHEEGEEEALLQASVEVWRSLEASGRAMDRAAR